MSAVPRNVWRLWASLGSLLAVGLVAYGHFLLTGSYDLLILFFRNAGAAFLLIVTSAAAYFADRARSQFDVMEPLHLAWTMVFLSASCEVAGALGVQVLSMDIAWNPLVLLGVFNGQRARTLRGAGLVVGGPVALALLSAGLSRVLSLKRQLEISGRLTALDRIFIGAIVIFAVAQLYEAHRMMSLNPTAVDSTQVLLWSTDPLLAVLLIQAVSIRRFALNLGHGLVARCWWMMAAGVAFTSLGDAFMWAETYGMIPTVFYPVGWFIWFFPATAFACAPCFQLEAMRLAHEGSYSLRFAQR